MDPFRKHSISIAPDRLERVIGILALVMLAIMLLAVARGMHQWTMVPVLVWAHMATVAVVLAITPLMMLRPRGTRSHRKLGYAWSSAMMVTALISLFVKVTHPGHFTAIHALSVVVIVAVPLLVLSARRHNVARHRRTARGLVIGALLVAGFFTLPFHRLLGSWLLA